jgi:hypothetical protein
LGFENFPRMIKGNKRGPKPKDKRLHVQITHQNLELMQKALRFYNDDPNRNTPKLRSIDYINGALAFYIKHLEGGKAIEDTDKSKLSKGFNLLIAPDNWRKIRKIIRKENGKKEKGDGKYKNVDVINDAIRVYAVSQRNS